MKHKVFLFFFAVFFSWQGWSQDQAELTGRQVMEQGEQLYNAASESFVIQMAQISGDNEQASPSKVVSLQMWLANENNLQSSLLKVFDPASLRGMGVLTVQQSAKQTLQQMYLPAVGTRTIMSNKKSDRFMGFDITFGDLEPEVLDRWEFQRLSDEVLDGQTCYLLEARPRDSQDIRNYGYSRRKIWLGQSTFFILKIEYFDPEGQLAKTQLNRDIVQVGKYWRANRIVVQNHSAKRLTILTFSDRNIGFSFPERFFSTRYLEMDAQAILRSLQ